MNVKPTAEMACFRIPDSAAIKASLDPAHRSLLRRLTVLQSVDSTNRYLAQLAVDQQHSHVVLADRQTAGQGRRGRHWHSPPGSNVYLSLGWVFGHKPGDLARLPLAVAVCIGRAMKKTGVENPGIKWPNDLQINGKKVAGTLLELKPARESGVTAVIGVGVNVCMPPDEDSTSAIQQDWTDLASHLNDQSFDDLRDRFCGLLIGELLTCVDDFESLGFNAFADEWSEMDVLKGKEVTVVSHKETFAGMVAGISEQGGLLLSHQNENGQNLTSEFFAGDVSIRPVDGASSPY